MTPEQDAAMTRYLSLVQRQPRLDREHERALVQRWKERADPNARDALIRSQLRSVTAIALRYRHYGLPLGELIAEGNLGLMHAFTRFEPAHGTRLATYAGYWIRAFVLNHAVRSFSAERNAAVRTALAELDPRERYIVERRLMADAEDEPSLAEIGERLGVSRERARQLEARAKRKLRARLSALGREADTRLLDLGRAA